MELAFLYPQMRVLVSHDWHAVLSTDPVEERRKGSQVSWHLRLECLQQGYISMPLPSLTHIKTNIPALRGVPGVRGVPGLIGVPLLGDWSLAHAVSAGGR